MTGLLPLLIILAIILFVWVVSRVSRSESGTGKQASNSPRQTSRPITSQKKPIISWIPANQEIKIAGYTIRSGFFYAGRSYRVNSWDSPLDPSLIDLDLQVRPPDPNASTPDLGYWPSYEKISPEARANYLSWLADGRSNPPIDIGYVFLFFYGLERRLLIDAKKSEQAKAEAPAIIAEVKKLLELYHDNFSFHNYASKFIEICQYLYSRDSIQARPPEHPLQGEFPLSLRMALSDFAINNKPIPPEWALSWLEHSVEFYARTPVHRCRNEFTRLFQIRYHEKFGDGFVVKPNKTTLRHEYRPASSAFQSPVVLEAKGAPDITDLKAPLKKLREIAETCTDDLDAYSRYLGRRAESSILGLGLLPSELLSESQEPQLPKLKEWLALSVGTEFSLIDAKELLEIFSFHSKSKIQKADTLSIAQLLAKLGYGMEPDPRFTNDSIDFKGRCVLFKVEGTLPSNPTEAYKTASLIMRLASIVIASDGSISSSEEQVLEQHIGSILDLTTSERNRLDAYLRWLMLKTPDMSGLKKRLVKLPVSQRQTAAKLMLLIANADNKIDPAEVKILTKIYKLLELNPESLFTDIHAIQTRPDELPVTILQPDIEPSGRSIPKPIKANYPSDVALNIEAIERTIRETQQVQQLLATVFNEEETNSQSKPAPAPSIKSNSVLGLDSTHSSLLTQLLIRPDWTRPALEALCVEYQVLPDGAIETINTAAIEKYGDLLFDLGDSLQLNHDIAKELHV